MSPIGQRAETSMRDPVASRLFFHFFKGQSTCSILCEYHVPEPTRLEKISKPLLSPDTRGTRETQEIVTSRISPPTLLLHMPLTDLQRRIYRLADSRSGTLESPAGRFFDPSAVGSMTTARPPLSLFIHPSNSCLCPDYCP